ncbi:MAG: response regulator transcription factor [Chlorobiaceae bacterium]
MTQSPNSPRIIIVEDDMLLRKSVVEYLALQGYDITSVGSAGEFYYQFALQPYDIAILDIGLPDQDGMVLSEYLRKNSGVRIIMFTARAAVEDKIAGYQAGADAYLVKPVDFRELALAIDAIVSRLDKSDIGAMSLAPLMEVTSCAVQPPWRLVTGKWSLYTPGGMHIKLSAKELEFMKLLCRDRGATASRLNLLRQLGYFNNDSGNRALESCVRRLRNKTMALHIELPVQTAYGVGYCFLADIKVE